MKYDELSPTIKTFDILNFSGRGFTSNFIKIGRLFATGHWSPLSHTGIVVVEHGRRFLFESTTLNGKGCVQLNPLSERLANYNGKVWIRQMICDRTRNRQELAEVFVQKTLGLVYEKHMTELFGSCVTTPFDANDDGRLIDNDYFCTELVVALLRYCGLFNCRLNSSEFDPAAFEDGGRGEYYLGRNKLTKSVPITP